MQVVVQVVAVVFVAIAMTPALAHALELPGKMRLTKEQYFAVQRIYYPGFTLAGSAEPASVIVTIVLLFFTSSGSLSFWLSLIALLGLVAMQIIYWIVVHPVNRVWVHGETLSSAGSGFFAFGGAGKTGREADWTVLRDRWEYAHAARAVLAAVSFVGVVVAIAL